MKETGGHSVKLEGGSEIIESIERILSRNSSNGTSWTYTSIYL